MENINIKNRLQELLNRIPDFLNLTRLLIIVLIVKTNSRFGIRLLGNYIWPSPKTKIWG